MTVRRTSAPSGSLLLTLSTTPSMSANMRAATPRGCIWAWLARRRVTMASSAITRPYRSAAGSSWISSAIAFTSGPRHPDGEWAGPLQIRGTPPSPAQTQAALQAHGLALGLPCQHPPFQRCLPAQDSAEGDDLTMSQFG